MMTGFPLNRACIDLMRAMSAAEARAIVNGITSSDGSCLLVDGSDQTWTCEPIEEGYRVTLPSGASGEGSTVANALAAARSI